MNWKQNLYRKVTVLGNIEYDIHKLSFRRSSLESSPFSKCETIIHFPTRTLVSPPETEDWVSKMEEKLKNKLSLNQRTFPALRKNAELLHTLHFDEDQIYEFMLRKKRLCLSNKSSQISIAASKLEALGIEVSQLGRRFIQRFESISEGKSDELLKFLKEKLGDKVFLEVMRSPFGPLHWNADEFRKKFELFQSFGIIIHKKFILSPTGPFRSRTTVTAKNIKGLIKLVGAERALKIIHTNPQVINTPVETVNEALRYLESLFGLEEAKQKLEHFPPLVTLTPSKADQMITGLSKFFETEDVKKILTKNPLLMAYFWDSNISPKLEFLLNKKKRHKDDIVGYPTALDYSLLKRMIPRFEELENRGINHQDYALITLLCRKKSAFDDFIKRKSEIQIEST